MVFKCELHTVGWVAGLGGFGGASASSPNGGGESDRTSTSVRLLTDLPPRRPVADQALAQRGACAGCRSPLPSPAKGTMFGSGAGKVCSFPSYVYLLQPRNYTRGMQVSYAC